MPNFIDHSGKHFCRWTVLPKYERRPHGSKTRIYWKCRCDCGTTDFIMVDNLTLGKSQSCGCLRSELAAQAHRTHGHYGIPEYVAWQQMKQRCYNPKVFCYHNYGGRGIRVCDDWKHSFSQFLADMGPKPSSKTSLDRIDNDGNYEPNNCRWATGNQQRRNTRGRLRLLTHNGQTMCLKDWSVHLDIRADQIRRRIERYGWSVAKALSTPITYRTKPS